MLFVVHCKDKAGSLDVRKANRGIHLEWLKELGPRLTLAGPLLTPDGTGPLGSMIIIEAETLAAARATMAADPYAKAGLFQSVDIHPWTRVFGTFS